MSTDLLNDDELEAVAQADEHQASEQETQQQFGDKLRAETTGCQLNRYSLSCRRTMNKQAIGQVADLFAADQKSIGGSREVINRKHALVKPIFALLSQCKAFVHAYTIDYPEKGVRLVRLSSVQWLSEKVQEYQKQLNVLLADLDAHWEDIKQDAKERLGDLYSADDYVAKPSTAFGIELSFPAIQPDDRLARLHPELYAQEQARITSRFQDAVADMEAQAAEELASMLKALVERLTVSGEEKKTIRSSTLDNLTDFTARWSKLSIGSNARLDGLIQQVQQAAEGVDLKTVRKSDGAARALLAEQFRSLQESVDSLVIARPKRNFILDDDAE